MQQSKRPSERPLPNARGIYVLCENRWAAVDSDGLVLESEDRRCLDLSLGDDSLHLKATFSGGEVGDAEQEVAQTNEEVVHCGLALRPAAANAIYPSVEFRSGAPAQADEHWRFSARLLNNPQLPPRALNHTFLFMPTTECSITARLMEQDSHRQKYGYVLIYAEHDPQAVGDAALRSSYLEIQSFSVTRLELSSGS